MSTTEQEHALMVHRLVKPGSEIIDDLTERKAELIHMAMGVCGEAGELLDAIKKHTIYDLPLDQENVIEELGDLEFFMRGLRVAVGISREETLVHNIRKLSKRYPKGKFTRADAKSRKDKK